MNDRSRRCTSGQMPPGFAEACERSLGVTTQELVRAWRTLSWDGPICRCGQGAGHQPKDLLAATLPPARTINELLRQIRLQLRGRATCSCR